MRRSLRAILSCVVLAACAEERTHISLEFPITREVIEQLEVMVFEGSGNTDEGELCFDLLEWGRASCGEDCDAVAPFAPGDVEPFFEETYDANSDGDFTTVEIKIPTGTSWSLFIIGANDEEPLAYGCRRVDSGENAMMRLWRPLCAAESCAEQYHPGCEAEIDCAAVANPPTEETLANPPCVINAELFAGNLTLVWSEGEMLCPPEPSAGFHFGVCEQAWVQCLPNELTPFVDGVCPEPTDDEEPCIAIDSSDMYVPEMDLNCDFQHPICDAGVCESGAVASCGSASTCIGSTRCVDGMWSPCQFGVSESCDGLDNDCDDDIDEDSAYTSCNIGLLSTAPIADGCDGEGNCLCGGGPVCVTGQACCSRACRDIASDEMNCGRCGRVCQAGMICTQGVCVAETNDAGVSAECMETSDCHGDGTCVDGNCVCGLSDACSGATEACCGDECVDLMSDEANCRSCGVEWRPGYSCCQGSCRTSCPG